MFYIIGLGLFDEKDITFRGLEVNNATSDLTILDIFLNRLSDHRLASTSRHTPAFSLFKRSAWYVSSPICSHVREFTLSPIKEVFYGKPLILADRDMVETESDEILKDAHTQDVSLLVVGDPFGATTHTDILLRARALGIPTCVIHNASIMNAVGACGLQLYNFGQAVSLVFFTDTWRPDSFYDRRARER